MAGTGCAGHGGLDQEEAYYFHRMHPAIPRHTATRSGYTLNIGLFGEVIHALTLEESFYHLFLQTRKQCNLPGAIDLVTG